MALSARVSTLYSDACCCVVDGFIIAEVNSARYLPKQTSQEIHNIHEFVNFYLGKLALGYIMMSKEVTLPMLYLLPLRHARKLKHTNREAKYVLVIKST